MDKKKKKNNKKFVESKPTINVLTVQSTNTENTSNVNLENTNNETVNLESTNNTTDTNTDTIDYKLQLIEDSDAADTTCSEDMNEIEKISPKETVVDIPIQNVVHKQNPKLSTYLRMKR